MPQWIHQFQLFLFDFDGLLVNTEYLQYAAYCAIFEKYGFKFPWNLVEYYKIAHTDSASLRKAAYDAFPDLYAKQPDWEVIRAEKREIYLKLLEGGKLELMPGVEKLLTALDLAGIKRCVVTHSKREEIEIIRKQLPQLDLIPFWVTREHYTNPKPAPDSFLKAIELFGSSSDRVVGFEDSLRGIKALIAAKCQPVWVLSPAPYHILDNVPHFSSFEAIPQDKLIRS